MIDYDIIVIGGGAAGMMAAISAAQMGAQVCLLERNPKVGRKLYITGKMLPRKIQETPVVKVEEE